MARRRSIRSRVTATLVLVALGLGLAGAFAFGRLALPALVEDLGIGVAASEDGEGTGAAHEPRRSSPAAEIARASAGADDAGSEDRVPLDEPADPADIVPSGKRILGVWTPHGPYDLSEADAFAEAAGQQPQALVFSQGWADSRFDASLLDDIEARGMLPVIAWEPWDAEQESDIPWERGEQPEYALARVLEGAFDDVIVEWARGLADWENPVGIRFAHEMNGYWYPWAESVNGNRAGEYVQVWRYVHDTFEAEGADNVIWIWSPNVHYPGATPLEGLYPGDDYVDWAGLVGFFGHGEVPPQDWPSFEEIYVETLDWIRALSDRPILLTEVGATEAGGHKDEWIAHVFEALEDERHEDVIGLVWFEEDKEADWRIVSSAAAQAAFAEGAASERFDWTYPP